MENKSLVESIKFKTQAKSIELIFDGHVNAQHILDYIREQTFGLYKGFVKWHIGTPDAIKNHTHVAIILREKPNILDAYKYFTIPKVGTLGSFRPHLVSTLGKGNGKPIKKLNKYVSYLVDGHDNGTYKDTWNYKYDHELDSCKDIVSHALCLMLRGHTYNEIYKSSNWDIRSKLTLNQKKILVCVAQAKEILTPPVPVALRQWQQECVDNLKSQDDRQILWVYDPKGNAGKTKLCKELKLHHDTAVFCNAGKKDLAFAFNDQKQIAFNLTRTTEGRVNYEAMESLKDGLIFSGKYESTTKVFTPPKMVVFSNTLPDYESMSNDRWNVFKIENGAFNKLPSPISQEHISYA